jgi:hypothetical protein
MEFSLVDKIEDGPSYFIPTNCSFDRFATDGHPEAAERQIILSFFNKKIISSERFKVRE